MAALPLSIISGIPQFSVTQKLNGSALCLLLYTMDKDIKWDRTQDRPSEELHL